MSNFIRLSNTLINTRYITKIKMKSNAYEIKLLSNHTGNIFGSGFFFWGDIYPSSDIITITADEHAIDYKIISDWLNNINTTS